MPANIFYNPDTGQLMRVRPDQKTTRPGPKNTTPGVGSDSMTPALSAWGTNHTGRGTDVTSPLHRLHDMTPVERQESIKRSRFIANRLGLGRALTEGTSRYAVGGGILGYAATDDQEYDDACDRFCDDIFQNGQLFDIRGELNYFEMQEVICPAMMVDGDLGAAKILGRDGNGNPAGHPALQLFTTEQIKSGLIRNEPTDGWLEGVKRDAFGRKTHYRVVLQGMPGEQPIFAQRSSQAERYHDFEAKDFLHILDPKRIGMSRGIPWTHHGQGSAITMMDLKVLEESAAYLNAFFGAVIETEDGKIPEGLEAMMFRTVGETTDENKSDAESSTTTTEKYRRYGQFMGGAWMPVLKKGEKLNMVASTRPSQTFTGFMDWLVNDIAWGYGVPPAYVWAIAGRTGPETRLTLSQADWFFQMIMRRMVSRFCKPVRDWVILWGLVTGRLNNGRPPRNGKSPYLARWHGPRKITIDEGREGKLEVDRIKAGLGTEEEFFARRGQDADTQAKRRIDEIAKRLAWCREQGVPWQLYFGMQPGQTFDLPGDAQNPAQPGNDPSPALVANLLEHRAAAGKN